MTQMQDKIEALKRMMRSCYAYESLYVDSYDYNTYILKYKHILGKELFDKTWNDHKKYLEDTYIVSRNTFTDSEGLTYNSLELKLNKL